MSFKLFSDTSGGTSSPWATSGSDIYNTNVGTVFLGSNSSSNYYMSVQSSKITISSPGNNANGELDLWDNTDSVSGKALSAANENSLASLIIGRSGAWGQVTIDVFDGAAYQQFRHIGTSLISTVLLDMSSIAASGSVFKVTATSDTPSVTFGSNTTHNPSTSPAGYLKITVASASRYIPFWA